MTFHRQANKSINREDGQQIDQQWQRLLVAALRAATITSYIVTFIF